MCVCVCVCVCVPVPGVVNQLIERVSAGPALIAARLNAGVILVVTDSVAIGIYNLPLPPPSIPPYPPFPRS